jgi:hypothetical protein
MPSSPVKVNRCFGGTEHLHLQVQRVSQGINQHEADSKQRAPRHTQEDRTLTSSFVENCKYIYMRWISFWTMLPVRVTSDGTANDELEMIRKDAVAHLLKARTLKAEKQPLLGNART